MSQQETRVSEEQFQPPATDGDFIIPEKVQIRQPKPETSDKSAAPESKAEAKTEAVSSDAEIVNPEETAKQESEKPAAEDQKRRPDREAAREARLLREARREAREAKAALEAFRREFETFRSTAGAPQKAVQGPPKPPSAKDYPFGVDDDGYLAAQQEYFAARDAYILAQAEERAAARYQDAVKQFEENQRLATISQKVTQIEQRGLDKYEDFAEVVEDALTAMPPATEALQALAMQDGAEDVVYHLAKNPAVLERIVGLSPAMQAFELGRMASQFAAKKSIAEKAVTKATATPTQPRGPSGQFTSAEDALYLRALKATR